MYGHCLLSLLAVSHPMSNPLEVVWSHEVSAVSIPASQFYLLVIPYTAMQVHKYGVRCIP